MLNRNLRRKNDTVTSIVFTWEDIEDRLEEWNADSWNEEYQLTMDQCKAHKEEFNRSIFEACMGRGDWTEAIDDVFSSISRGDI